LACEGDRIIGSSSESVNATFVELSREERSPFVIKEIDFRAKLLLPRRDGAAHPDCGGLLKETAAAALSRAGR
jgi:hypothetical protein